MRQSPRRLVALFLVALGVVWLLVNKSVGEGPTLLVLGGGHGVTASDLVSLALFLAASALWFLPVRSHRSQPPA